MTPRLETYDRLTDVTGEIAHLRRDLRGLVMLEALQMAAAIGALVAIAIRAIVVAGDLKVAVLIAALVLLALSYLVLGLRIRAGQELVRRELRAMEQRHGLDVAHPYRSSATRNCDRVRVPP